MREIKERERRENHNKTERGKIRKEGRRVGCDEKPTGTNAEKEDNEGNRRGANTKKKKKKDKHRRETKN